MRTIKFRGLREDGKGWVYGSYYVGVMYPTSFTGHYVNDHSITPKTVGQLTGLKDKNGVDIYEGDVIIYADDAPNTVTYEECCFGYRVGKKIFLKLKIFNNVNKLEVIGNIHESKES